MNLIRHVKKLTFLCVALQIFYSCEADIDLDHVDSSIEFQQSVLVPLGSIKANFSNVLENYDDGNNFSKTENSGFLYTYLDSTEFSFNTYNFQNLAQAYTTSVKIGNNNLVIPAGANITASLWDSIYFSINQQPAEERIDSIKFSKALINFVLNNVDLPIPATDLTVVITFPQNRIRMLTPGASNQIIIHPQSYGLVNTAEMDNFMMYFDNNSHYLPLDIQVIIQNGATPVLLTSQSAIQFNMSFGSMDYVAVFGYLNRTFENSQTFSRKLDFVNSLPNSLIKIANPQFQLTTTTNIGSYLKIKADYIRAFSSVDPAFTPVYLWFDNHTTNSVEEILSNRPKIPGEWATNNLKTLDKDWGETYRLFEKEEKPDMIEYKFSTSLESGVINNDPVASFITSDPQMKIKFRVTLPLYLNSESYIQYSDTISNILDSFNDVAKSFLYESLDSLCLMMNVTNGFPLSAKINLIFLNDENAEIQTNVQKNFTLSAGEVDSEGLVEKGKASRQNISIVFIKQELDKILKMDKIAFKIIFEGKDIHSNIQFSADDFIDIKAGIMLRGKIKTN